jgi:hypothetical protein
MEFYVIEIHQGHAVRKFRVRLPDMPSVIKEVYESQMELIEDKIGEKVSDNG